jgi:hypothetical protein
MIETQWSELNYDREGIIRSFSVEIYLKFLVQFIKAIEQLRLVIQVMIYLKN